MNPLKNPVCSGVFNFGSISGNGIREIHPFRIRKGELFKDGKERFQRGDWYGFQFPVGSFGDGSYDKNLADAEELGLRHGYTHRYGRNLTRFVQSRAARRRGYVSLNEGYNRRRMIEAERGRALSLARKEGRYPFGDK